MSKINDYINSSNKFNEVDKNRDSYLIIHYSCESFYKSENGFSKRITSIAARKLSDGQTDLFAIHKTTEVLGIAFDDIVNNYNILETHM